MNDLENAKIGDKLIVEGRWNKQLLTVEKVQKNFVIAGNCKFRKATGYLVPTDRWNVVSAKIATKEDISDYYKERKRNRMINQCKKIVFENLSDLQLNGILAIANNES